MFARFPYLQPMRLIILTLSLLLAVSSPAQTSLATRLDSFFRSQPAGRPGFVLSIEKNGEVLYRNATGLADLTTSVPLDSLSDFRMASVSKQFTAMGILLLEKSGTLSLDDPIGRWLPGLPTDIGHRVLIRHLLTHSSGVLDYESLIPAAQTTQVLDADVLRLLSTHDSTYFVPGSRFLYSNSGFCLLALIIERASHESFPEYIRRHIFLPLHMDSSIIYSPGQAVPRRAMGYARDSAGHIVPSDQSVTSATKGDGGVYTSLADYAKWTRALQQNYFLRLADVMRRLRFPIAGMPNSSKPPEAGRPTGQTSAYAAGWFELAGSPLLLFHSGSTCGFANFVVQVPADNLSIVYFSNIAGNTAPFREIVRLIKQSGLADPTPALPLQDLTQ
jgi:CubicO group peptidase (beta-lactamase class C family)